mgnify:CR=1 FL=1
MNQKDFNYLSNQTKFHCSESYRFLIDNLEDLNITIKQQKLIKNAFDNLNMNLQAEFNQMLKSDEESK